ETADGERVLGWHVPPRANEPVVIYFHGNGGALNLRVDRFQKIIAAGIGLVALSYRGYGGSSGRPSEAGLIEDARAAYAFAAERYAGRIALWGESLGTGVAVALAAEKPTTHLILDAPYSSTVDVAADLYWFLPVRWLMKDQFRSDERIKQVKAPVLILHGRSEEHTSELQSQSNLVCRLLLEKKKKKKEKQENNLQTDKHIKKPITNKHYLQTNRTLEINNLLEENNTVCIERTNHRE